MHSTKRWKSPLLENNKYFFKTQNTNFKPVPGQVVNIKGEVSKIRKPTNPGQFDYEKYLQTQGYSCAIKISEMMLRQNATFPWTWIIGIRTHISQTIAENISPADSIHQTAANPHRYAGFPDRKRTGGQSGAGRRS